MIAIPQGGGFKVRSSLGSLGLMPVVHSVFSNKDLPLTSGRQLSNSNSLFGDMSLLDSPKQQRGFLIPGVVSPGVIFHLNYIYI